MNVKITLSIDDRVVATARRIAATLIDAAGYVTSLEVDSPKPDA